MHYLTLLKKIFLDNFEAKFDILITTILDKYSDHPNINRKRVIDWIKQFPPKFRKICEKIIDYTNYYSASSIQALTNQLVKMVYDEYQNYRKNEIAFVPIGGAGSGSQLIARRIKSLKGIPQRNVIDLFELTQTDIRNKLKAVVFIDDFSGTGNTITQWWFNIEPLILPLSVDISFGILVLNYKADNEIRKINTNIFFVEFIQKNKNVFDNSCSFFSNNEKSSILKICKMTGCNNSLLKGYGDCGLLISFQHGCPNNSLPILWYSSNKWTNLFNTDFHCQTRGIFLHTPVRY